MKKQKIYRYDNGNIWYIINKNSSGQYHGLSISYNPNGNILYIINYVNGKRFGFRTNKYSSGETQEQIYQL